MSDSEFDDPDYERFVSSLSDEDLEPSPGPSSAAASSTVSSAAPQVPDAIEELVASLENVSLQSATPPRTPPRRPRPISNDPLYRVHSPTKGTIVTREWSLAADIVQSERDARAIAEVKRPKSRKAPKVYVVFIGKEPGVYPSWDDCEAQITGVPSVHQGYSSHSEAANAFEWAVQQGLASRRIAGQPAAVPTPHAQQIDFLLDPESAFDNALNIGITRQRWYNVYQGRSPGIYRTNLECSLNVLLVSNAAHDSFFTLEEARDSYIDAMIGQRIRVRI